MLIYRQNIKTPKPESYRHSFFYLFMKHFFIVTNIIANKSANRNVVISDTH